MGRTNGQKRRKLYDSTVGKPTELCTFCGDELKNLCLKILTFIVYHLSHFTLYTTPIHFENLTMFEPQNKNAKNIVSRYNFCCTT